MVESDNAKGVITLFRKVLHVNRFPMSFNREKGFGCFAQCGALGGIPRSWMVMRIVRSIVAYYRSRAAWTSLAGRLPLARGNSPEARIRAVGNAIRIREIAAYFSGVAGA